MSQAPSAPATHPTGRPAATTGGPAVSRQFVNFAFYKLDPAFRRLSDNEKLQARSEFLQIIETKRQGLMCIPYSTVGVRAETDFMLWRISLTTDTFQEQSAAINKSRMGAYLTQPHSFLSMTKRSMYIDKLDPFHTAESRTHIIPGKRKYIFVYPFIKTRDWYLLPQEKRQEIMDEHIKVGNKYPSIKLNTTYSFGLDDQDFVVAFESEEPKDFLDLVMELRETQSSKYTVRDTPTLTCVQMPMGNVLDQLF
ncbi:chlorite dismutase family protein [Humisphaera borealis]|uniref:Chlorite dismutase family protein n=1 Tax=Humisphaera borealis TaxID=2807512 RepID=A0A7M2WUX2_9BACT|nr:chlorite dismutase family protein [Humisphaera borealis]QOV89246.1 chlorite dismutase family protein [Humisphaera borealis]